MKVVVFKNYVKSSIVYLNYDDYENIYHGFNTLEDVREVTEDEFNILCSAIKYFNSKNNTLGVLKIYDDDEYSSLISDYNSYLKNEELKLEKIKADNLAIKAKNEAKKNARTLKRLAKELGISEEEVLKIKAK